MSTTSSGETLQLGPVKLDVERRGKGRPLLVLHGEDALEFEAPAIAAMASGRELIIPSPPGFGRSERPEWVSSPDDVSYMYLDLVAKLGLRDVDVVGFGFGGWIAAEMATKDQSWLGKLVLVDAVGVKVGGALDRDIQDIWTLKPDKVAALKWHDPAKGVREYSKMSEEQLTIVARNVESLARFCWDPYMHNPKLKQRLHRITRPTLVVWGENDGIVTPAYGKGYAAMIPGAKFVTVAKAGHYPHIEQPEAFLGVVNGFLG